MSIYCDQNPHRADEVLKDDEVVSSETYPMTCLLRGPELSERTTLRRHMKKVHPRNETWCIWPACKVKFGSQVDLQAHIALVHQDEELSQQQRKRKLGFEEMVDGADEKVDCQVPGCGGSFENFEVMLRHFKTMHQLKGSRILKWRLKKTQVLELKRLGEANRGD